MEVWYTPLPQAHDPQEHAEKVRQGRAWGLLEMEQNMRNPESDLRRRIDRGRDVPRMRSILNGIKEQEFWDADALAADVQRDLQEWTPRPSACPANPRQLALLDSGASDHMIGRSLLTPAEQASIYKIEPKEYELAEG